MANEVKPLHKPGMSLSWAMHDFFEDHPLAFPIIYGICTILALIFNRHFICLGNGKGVGNFFKSLLVFLLIVIVLGLAFYALRKKYPVRIVASLVIPDIISIFTLKGAGARGFLSYYKYVLITAIVFTVLDIIWIIVHRDDEKKWAEAEKVRIAEEEKARAEAEAKRKAEAEAKAKARAEAEAKRKAEAEARARAEAAAAAKRKAEEDARKAREKAEAEARAKAEAEARAKAEAEKALNDLMNGTSSFFDNFDDRLQNSGISALDGETLLHSNDNQ